MGSLKRAFLGGVQRAKVDAGLQPRRSRKCGGALAIALAEQLDGAQNAFVGIIGGAHPKVEGRVSESSATAMTDLVEEAVVALRRSGCSATFAMGQQIVPQCAVVDCPLNQS